MEDIVVLEHVISRRKQRYRELRRDQSVQTPHQKGKAMSEQAHAGKNGLSFPGVIFALER